MNFIQVRSYDNYIYAHIVLSMLQDAGINCYLKDEYTITIDPLLSPALGGIRSWSRIPSWSALGIAAERGTSIES
jgi:hypothetical protein